MSEFDYIVVGAGSAGCVLAARLSEDNGKRVLLLEAGANEPLNAVAVPSIWPTLQGTSQDWANKTVPQAEAGGQEVPWPRGRGLGGSSLINAMVYLRGHRSSYDSWVRSGVGGWGYDDLLPYFKRSENLTGVANRDPAVRGMNGPLRVSPAEHGHPLSEAFLKAAAEAGRPVVDDISSGLAEGFGYTDLSIFAGSRFDAATAYLRPVMDRPNLHVVTDALVHRLVFTGDRCTGVQYSIGAQVFTAHSAGETVLSAGAVGSPQLLMLSGVGPAEHLRQMDISVLADLPGVGGNLQDHPMSGIVYEASRPVPAGPNNHVEAVGLISTDLSWNSPYVQVAMVDLPLRARHLPGPEVGHGYTIMVCLMTPRSSGALRLASAVPGQAPRIDPRYYSDELDVRAMTQGLRAARDIGTSGALAEWLGKEDRPGPSANSDGDLRAHLRSNLRAYDHFSGTCRMGGDAASVVDAELRVHGVEGLRIADASIFPAIPSANTNATVYSIAERAADLLAGR